MNNNQVKASDCKCCVCGQQAVAFWPVIDPDIPSHPYCRKCLDREKLKAMIATFGDEKGQDYFNAWNADKKKPKKKK
ncbi:MAG: hypothetical protein IJ551_09535 [Prevotella sp.]|nr:hypothetical protein [Prevotella sp.]